MLSDRLDGAWPLRNAARPVNATSPKQPPRTTRAEPLLSYKSSHHCHRLPCISCSPSLFAGYVPTIVAKLQTLRVFAGHPILVAVAQASARRMTELPPGVIRFKTVLRPQQVLDRLPVLGDSLGAPISSP
jgi:hypothetical protein